MRKRTRRVRKSRGGRFWEAKRRQGTCHGLSQSHQEKQAKNTGARKTPTKPHTGGTKHTGHCQEGQTNKGRNRERNRRIYPVRGFSKNRTIGEALSLTLIHTS